MISVQLIFKEQSAVSKKKQRLNYRRKTFHGTSFIPPNIPHYGGGGIWEANIKYTKRHLLKVMGEDILTIQAFNTLLIKIEACLNSRPLCLIKESEEITVLTPGHFLIQQSLMAPPRTEETIDVSTSLSKRWQHIEKISDQFWIKWKTQMIQNYQYRPRKWSRPTRNFQVGDVDW